MKHIDNCPVCKSPNRVRYERRWRWGDSYRKLSAMALYRYNEKLSLLSFEEHMENHLEKRGD